LALLALAAAIGPTAAAAGACLLGTAAVLCVLDSHPVAAVTGVPGFVALLSGARATPGGASAALAAAATVAAIVMATQVRRRDAHAGGGASSPARAPSGVTLAVVVLGAWLVTVPRAWVWIGRSAFGAYDRGAAVALATGLLVVTASACRSFRDAARPQRRV
jgi:hypothetical protein